MTIYVTVSPTFEFDLWDYSYDDMYDMLWVDRIPRNSPLSTLQGAYSLIIKVDRSNIVSYFETVGTAEVNCWTVVPSLAVPKPEHGRVLVAQDVDDGQRQAYFTNPHYTVFYTRLGELVESVKLRHVAIGQQVIVDITQDGMLVGVWMLDLPPEIGKKHAMKQSM